MTKNVQSKNSAIVECGAHICVWARGFMHGWVYTRAEKSRWWRHGLLHGWGYRRVGLLTEFYGKQLAIRTRVTVRVTVCDWVSAKCKSDRIRVRPLVFTRQRPRVPQWVRPGTKTPSKSPHTSWACRTLRAFLPFTFEGLLFFSLITVLVSSLEKANYHSTLRVWVLVQIEMHIRRFNVFPPSHFLIRFCRLVLANCRSEEQHLSMVNQSIILHDGLSKERKKLASKLSFSASFSSQERAHRIITAAFENQRKKKLTLWLSPQNNRLWCHAGSWVVWQLLCALYEPGHFDLYTSQVTTCWTSLLFENRLSCPHFHFFFIFFFGIFSFNFWGFFFFENGIFSTIYSKKSCCLVVLPLRVSWTWEREWSLVTSSTQVTACFGRMHATSVATTATKSWRINYALCRERLWWVWFSIFF